MQLDRSVRAKYLPILAEYVRRFHDQPPSILSDAGALELMVEALRRGTPIRIPDMSPAQADDVIERASRAAKTLCLMFFMTKSPQ